MDIVAVYTVKNNQLVLEDLKDLSDDEKTQHLMMWERVNQLIPDSYKKYVKSLEIGTDGVDGILASVTEMENLSKWSLFLDIKDSINDADKFKKDFDYTVLHEFGHILSLNNSQLSEEKISGTYSTEEGYSKEASYLNAFYQTFWQHDTYTSEYNRYDENPTHFVSDYAATNVEEDMAESFAKFIVDEKVTGQRLADQKVRFFYQYSELIKLRNDIRKNL